MALGYFGSPHGNIDFDGVKDPETHRALEEIDAAITDLEQSIRKASVASPLRLKAYTIATLPPPGDYTGCIVYVSDGSGVNNFRGSNGTIWVTLG
jgi:hypothetical protein